MNPKVSILRGPPVVVLLAQMELNSGGLSEVYDYYEDRRPDCVSEKQLGMELPWAMLPHDQDDWPHDIADQKPSVEEWAAEKPQRLSDNAVLCEIAGRSCYASFGSKAGRKTNKQYLEHIHDVKHASVIYHAKMSFFLAGISRRVSHELIRTYVGADRTEEGSPSQESTRFTHHTGYFIEPPYIEGIKDIGERYREREAFEATCQQSYNNYKGFIKRQVQSYKDRNKGKEPRSLKRKRIFEAASGYLHHSCETSMVWTTNPMALTKQFFERTTKYTDLEYVRFAARLMDVAYNAGPNLFPDTVANKLEELADKGLLEQ